MLTKRGALVELAIVTAGVLIALSFDGARGWMRERSLVQDARVNLTRELRANKQAVEQFLKTLPEREKELDRLEMIATALLERRPVTGEAAINIVLADITSAAYATTQITGGFGLMDYDEVALYTGVYDLQSRITGMQDEAVRLLQAVTARTWVIDAKAPPLRDVELWRQDIYTVGAHLFFLKQFAEQLVKGYDEVLARAS